MEFQIGVSTPTPPACPKKAIELFFVTHPKAPKALLGPFLSQEDAACGLVVMRSAEAVVTSSLVDGIDELTRWTGINNGAICRAFAGTSGGHHE
ncbi:hypothetical protein QN408_11175 [Pseudomonas sp. CCI4.2]|uniref:hypothetical protein n=1 Tax=Pseudomonas sp. CCI4.2 TaxID=3048620 RepID=UPI002B22DA9B|nr:hypothetical protein [Pseudomonas sp. CCI4.2]MEB0091796.1 hypothetical protein [Pseudomonas sp. CCI4.2]